MSGVAVGGTGAGQDAEVRLAEIENRLRRAMLRILRPALDGVSAFSLRLDKIQGLVEKLDGMVNSSEVLRVEVRQLAEVTQSTRDLLATQHAQANSFEQRVIADVAELRKGGSETMAKLDGLQAELRKQGREVAHLWEDLDRTDKRAEESAKKSFDGITVCMKKLEEVRVEFLSRLDEVEIRRQQLMDDLFGDDKGLSVIQNKIQQLTAIVAPFEELDTKVTLAVNRTYTLEDRQDSMQHLVDKAQKSYSDFQMGMEQSFCNRDQEINSTMNMLTAHHATMLMEIRADFSKEMNAMRVLREQIGVVETKTLEACEELRDQQATETRRIDAIHKELVTDIDEIHKRRKKERLAVDGDVKLIRSALGECQAVTGDVSSGMAHLGRILGLVLESHQLTNSLHIQDYADRRAERWLGHPADTGRCTPPPCTAEMLNQLRHGGNGRNFRDATGGSGASAAVDLRKCGPLLSAEYLPGPVALGGTHYNREDVLLLQHKLLERARVSFSMGPAAVLQKAGGEGDVHVPTTMQPCANGGMATGQLPLKSSGKHAPCDAEEDPLDVKSTAPSTTAPSTATRVGFSGQRPGSQGQPQAMGSRGLMDGPLGETSPPPPPGGADVPPPAGTSLRLPAIGSGAGHDETAPPSKRSSRSSGPAPTNPRPLACATETAEKLVGSALAHGKKCLTAR